MPMIARSNREVKMLAQCRARKRKKVIAIPPLYLNSYYN
jgi:hypothetical protein